MQVYNTLITKLAQAGISSPRMEAKLLLAFLLKKEENSIDILNAQLNQEQQNELACLLHRRINNREPLDKILGHKGFYKYDFFVNSDVLSPRPETEILLEKALSLAVKEDLSILDLGTGSGCILLSLLKERPLATGVGVDVSAKALDVARKNAENLAVSSQVKWLNKSWFDEDFLSFFSRPFDIIVSNPPYIADAEIKTLDKEVREYDPLPALSGGRDGLESYRRIAEVTPFLLSKEGYILLECGLGQADQVNEIFIAQGLEPFGILKDLQGIERCIILKK
ncbi:MAG: peptide chain release factor N(5)-glutamine methyltransferase [Alphaproteobacteria bacterium]|nr:peptide chain release factor N(5)-glutamine methyltransferase [Alphaproteobacteria bacterium]MBQ8677895.1 peptide chain release factor N(5)-glutamine methyltransferase [Alphaproteobacteria bacterium]